MAHALADLVDMERLQRLCDSLSAASGVVLAVLDPDGDILVSSGWQDICTQFHRRDPETAACCLESDQRINERLRPEVRAPQHISYRCANGLWDVALPLVIEGEHLANVFTGQFFYDDDQVDVESFRRRAQKLGFNEEAYLAALARVPVVTHEQVAQTISFLVDLVGALGELGLAAVRREREHAALLRSEEHYRSLADDLPAYVIAFEADGTITYANTALASTGASAGSLIGRNVYDLIDPDQVASVMGQLAALSPGDPVESHEQESLRDGGVTWEQWTSRAFFDANGHAVRYQAVGEDVTEKRRAEAEVARLNADLERRVAERTAQLEATNKELESFAYAISHDLRTPLRALDGFSEILIEDYGDRLDEPGRAHLQRIRGAAGHMAELMDGLLQLSRVNHEELQRQPVDISAMAAAIVDDLRRDDGPRRVDVSIADGLVAEADAKLTRVVLENLIGNAWKFTARREEAHIEVGVTEADGAPAFFVKDDGAGFDMRHADKLFGAFQRLHTPEQFEGTGIGLATVQRIVHRHGGSVWAEGEIDRGATFWFRLESAVEA